MADDLLRASALKLHYNDARPKPGSNDRRAFAEAAAGKDYDRFEYELGARFTVR